MNKDRSQIIYKNVKWWYLIVGLSHFWSVANVFLRSYTPPSSFRYLFNMPISLYMTIIFLLGVASLIGFWGLSGKKTWGRTTALWIGSTYIVWALLNLYQYIVINGSIVSGILFVFEIVGFGHVVYFLLKERNLFRDG